MRTRGFDAYELDEAGARLQRNELEDAMVHLSRSHPLLADLHRKWERDRSAAVADALASSELAITRRIAA